MSITKKFIFTFLFLIIPITISLADIKKVGKFKDWESLVIQESSGKVCFAQSTPVLQAPKTNKRDARLFVTFRPAEDIKDEVSITSGHDYKSSTVTARSGKRKYSFFSQKSFAWLLDDQEERKFIKLMQKATDVIVKARTTNGAETTDHYSMMGFTKAYNTAKKTCS